MNSELEQLMSSEAEAVALGVLLEGSLTPVFSSSDSTFPTLFPFLGFATLFGSAFLLAAGFLTLDDFL